MQLRTLLVALLLVVAAGPALATGAVAAEQPAQTTAAQDDALDCEYPIEVEDATGETVRIEDEPEEIVILYPNVAQHVWEIGAQEKVVGMPVNDNTAYLEGSEDREHILTQSDQGFDVPDTEKIVDMDHDLVLSPNVTPRDAVQELRDSGQTVFHYPLASDFEDVMALVERTGQLVGDCESAQAVTGEMADRIATVEEATADVEEPRVFYDLGDEPVGPFTVNENAFEHQVLDLAGAENIAADINGSFAGAAYPQISTEEVIGEKPEYVVAPGPLSEFPGYNETPALQNDQVIQVNGDFISQHGPRTVDVLVNIAEELHPDAMAAAQADGTGDDGSEDGAGDGNDGMDGNGMDDDTTDDEGTDGAADDSGPGLTVGVAAAALVALALLAVRRE